MYTPPSALPLLVILASFFSSTGAASASKSAIAGIKVNLRLSKLVPAFIDPFEPKGVLSIAFGKQTTLGNGATIGRRLSESSVAQQPVFAFTPVRGFPISEQDKFTIAMVDVDAGIRHLVASNLQVSPQTFQNGSFSLQSAVPPSSPYISPSPPRASPAHRYLFILYTQPNSFSSFAQLSTSTRNFNLKSFSKQAPGFVPISATFFTVQSGAVDPTLMVPVDQTKKGKTPATPESMVKKNSGERLEGADWAATRKFFLLLVLLVSYAIS